MSEVKWDKVMDEGVDAENMTADEIDAVIDRVNAENDVKKNVTQTEIDAIMDEMIRLNTDTTTNDHYIVNELNAARWALTEDGVDFLKYFHNITVVENEEKKSSLIPDYVTDKERVNLTRILTWACCSAEDPRTAKEQVREGFEAFMRRYSGEAPPFTINDNGDHYVWTNAVLFILDHMTPSFTLVSIKQDIHDGDTFEHIIPNHVLSNYVVTGIDKETREVSEDATVVFNDAKKIAEVIVKFVQKVRRVANF